MVVQVAHIIVIVHSNDMIFLRIMKNVYGLCMFTDEQVDIVLIVLLQIVLKIKVVLFLNEIIIIDQFMYDNLNEFRYFL